MLVAENKDKIKEAKKRFELMTIGIATIGHKITTTARLNTR
jgi:hypothetical protein